MQLIIIGAVRILKYVDHVYLVHNTPKLLNFLRNWVTNTAV